MEWTDLAGQVTVIAGFLVIALNALAVAFQWRVIPPNIFIIGLGLVVIGLVLLWNAGGEAAVP
jgi:hypothetical protein